MSSDDCDALAPHVAIASNQIATIAARTAGATSPMSPIRQYGQDFRIGLFAAVSIDPIRPSNAAGLECDQHACTKHGQVLDLNVMKEGFLQRPGWGPRRRSGPPGRTA